jgi:hypothetical protein
MNAARLVVLMIGLGRAGCSTVGRYAQVDDTVSKFHQGVHTVRKSIHNTFSENESIVSTCG